MKTLSLSVALVTCLGAGSAPADTIVQDGSLAGGEGQTFHEIVLDRFDPQGGARRLNFVQLDFVTAVIGGGETTGAGGTVSVFAEITADYFLDGVLLAETQALVDTEISNGGPPIAYSVFDNDIVQIVLDQHPDIVPWCGRGKLVMDAVVEFTVEEDPPGATNFGAGGSVQYTVTYDFDVVSVPGDLDGDGLVNTVDLLALLAAWGGCGESCPADFDCDGTVGVTDLLILLANWS